MHEVEKSKNLESIKGMHSVTLDAMTLNKYLVQSVSTENIFRWLSATTISNCSSVSINDMIRIPFVLAGVDKL